MRRCRRHRVPWAIPLAAHRRVVQRVVISQDRLLDPYCHLQMESWQVALQKASRLKSLRKVSCQRILRMVIHLMALQKENHH